MILDRKATRPVAALIVEPIQGEGGDNHASIYFFTQLQKICKEVSLSFIFSNLFDCRVMSFGRLNTKIVDDIL